MSSVNGGVDLTAVLLLPLQATASLLIYCIVTESSLDSMYFFYWEKKEVCWENVCSHVGYNRNTGGKKEEDVFIAAFKKLNV